MQQHRIILLLIAKGLVGIVLLMWLASTLIQLAHIIMPSDAPAAISPANDKLINSNANPSLPEVDIAALMSIALFGEVVDVPSDLVVEPKEAVVVETQLNLLLKGLFTSDNPKLGRAIITNGKKEALYRVGDEIEGLSNVKLMAVFKDRINLDNRGNTEVLYLYPESERLSPSNSPNVPAFVDNSSEPDVIESVDRQLNTETEKAGVKKLNQIMRVVRERNKLTGEMLGFRVLPGRNRHAFKLSGLKPNDVIISMDGELLTDWRSAMAIYRNKRNATRVSLIIRRDDHEISLDLDLDTLNL
ncbi:hypothetical protein AB835_03050 [Candidatus Endobugula sertula]|uniref:Type II secretion system protein GspC N-terminal domain-containing protein n=1 Tax=Candidatus Endobugula sertula TaxID=62101 RepID=A0A1D2QSN7_9GAMM|nr:hypothetical protein AB835_03050 [Candidatus Endobugula sertula]